MLNFLKFQKAKNKLEDIMQRYALITCCFTGHRSQKLPWKFNEEDPRCLEMKLNTKNAIIEAIQNGYKNFISGMALGFDMICAEIILELKKKYPDIKLICALPCKGQEKVWSNTVQQRYRNILKKADKIRCVYNKYEEGCMQERNQYMVNNSSLIIALFNGANGGTKQTIEYARSEGKKVVIIKP